MSSTKMPWFRMHTDAVDDEKLRLIAPSDRWYFFAILCCKGKGIIDDGGALLKRKVAVKLGLQVDELDEVVRRLAEVGLIDRETLQPFGWEGRQFKSDGDSTATDRKRRQREREKQSGETSGDPESGHAHVTRDVTDCHGAGHDDVTRTDTDTDTDTDTEAEKDKDTTHTRKRGADSSSDQSGGGIDSGKPLTARDLVAEGVDGKHARDWLALRKAKRLPLTPTAWDDVKEQAIACGMTPAQAVEYAVKANWAGFKAKWMAPDQTRAPTAQRLDRNDRSAAAAAIFPQQSMVHEVINA